MLYFVNYMLKTKETYILLYFKHVLNYIKRRYSFKVRIFYKDRKTTIRLGN
jgi:hypothetical protein